MDNENNLLKQNYLFSILVILRRLKVEILGTIFSNNLTKLAQLFGTDKWGLHYYTPHYQFHLKKFKYRKIKLLEIGVGGYKSPLKGGNSLRMWKNYFPFGKIYSFDIYDKKKLQESRIKIFQGSQVDEKFLNQMINEIGEIDIIIDDGSHINSHVINTFELLFPYLKDGGIYIIEDLETSYRDDFGGDNKNLDNPDTSMNFFKAFPDRINWMEFNSPNFASKQYDTQLQSIHFYHNLIIIYKNSYSEKPIN